MSWEDDHDWRIRRKMEDVVINREYLTMKFSRAIGHVRMEL
jgi:hypothetical protein